MTSEGGGWASFAFGMATTAVHDHSAFLVLARRADLGVVDGPPADVAAKPRRLGDETRAVLMHALHRKLLHRGVGRYPNVTFRKLSAYEVPALRFPCL
jgi:hypothetical protein